MFKLKRRPAPTLREIADEKLAKLHEAWSRDTGHLPRPYVRGDYALICLDCRAIFEPGGPESCPACAGSVIAPLHRAFNGIVAEPEPAAGERA